MTLLDFSGVWAGIQPIIKPQAKALQSITNMRGSLENKASAGDTQRPATARPRQTKGVVSPWRVRQPKSDRGWLPAVPAPGNGAVLRPQGRKLAVTSLLCDISVPCHREDDTLRGRHLDISAVLWGPDRKTLLATVPVAGASLDPGRRWEFPSVTT